ncbi:T9SS type A sorting domain-containing protein [uncultured Dokdonia sp.]|uniref:T9SS type A sorting domain-containing protein n=1 Tax=uncultured Dokdonia sp. TaxID=575653 RepID=UPI0026043DD4|nr:T9SS type A sorting domain-containing protein [uncultured Dokdonia sp.]
MIILLFLIPSSKKEVFATEEKASRPEYPNEWMYNQRAYPDNFISKQAINLARTQRKNIMTNRATQEVDWEFVGPLNIRGRVTDVAISPVNNDHLYITTAVGGVFRSLDKGLHWDPIFDDIGIPSIGNIAIAPSDAQRIYVGTGEANGSATSGAFLGNGIYRSDDGGDSWTSAGLEATNHIGRVVVDPTNSDRVFVAATGILYGKNDERGIYRTTSGGDDWEQVLFVTDSTAAIDVVMNPIDTDVIFAAMWERTRKPYQRDYGGVTSAIHRSTDGGDTWEILTNGLPVSDEQTGRIGLAISESDPNIVYARYTTNEITNVFDGVYKSIDNGNSWTLISNNALNNIDASFGWYFGNIRVHPDNADEVFVLGQRLFKTLDSGSSWQSVNGMHVDHHAMEFSRLDADFILAGNDGGAYISEDRGVTWTPFLNLPITQFYNIEVDFTNPENLFGGTQDNNSIRIANGDNTWFSVWGGDGFHVNVDPVDNSFAYVESQFGNLARSTDGGFNFTSALNGIDPSDRTNWNTPVILSPFNPEIVYYGSNKLYLSENRAVNWTAISDDLTDGLHPSGSLSFGTLTAIAASYTNTNTIYTGSDDGNIYVTFDGGNTWENISDGLPDRYITSLAIHPEEDQTAYVTLSGFSNLDYTPHVFKTINGGQSWEDISSNLPSIPANDVIIVPSEVGELLIVATDMSVWYSEDDGSTWDILGNDLPPTITRDLKYHQPTQTLYAGTFGRSIYQINLSTLVLSLEENTITNRNTHIFPNPVIDQFTIDHLLQGEGSIILYTITGQQAKVVYEGNLENTKNTFYTSGTLTSGIYLLQIKSQDNKITKKLIIH